MKALLLRYMPSLLAGGWVTYAVIGGVLLLAVGWARVHWIHVGREQVLRENVTAATKIVTKQGAVTVQVVKEYVKVAGKTKVVTETVEKEVIKYADQNPGMCLDIPWRVLHDAAAANTVPVDRRGADGAVRTPAVPVR